MSEKLVIPKEGMPSWTYVTDGMVLASSIRSGQLVPKRRWERQEAKDVIKRADHVQMRKEEKP